MDINRRDFLKALAFLASMPVLNKLKFLTKEPVREGIAKVADKGIDFYNAVIQKVIREGKKIDEQNRIEVYTHPDRPDIKVEVDKASGDSNVSFLTDQETKAYAEIKTEIGPETKGVPVQELQETEEVYKTVSPEGDYVKDIEEGIKGGTKKLEEFLGRDKKKDGGIMELTIMQIPDIKVEGVESLFNSR